ncbi:putative unusual protein kinase regulating ubiquinone biosynthesis (AarF/ABC1/UbiB family) [Gillisia mitskevichiae]|uniref:Putative unusual protein kinase regulating ubiquinone biosynthesis (AarF/ABC1/UbiB family) n=1 Tax=Gillisia mitskevichiae TaxID=270921 RepID=A0A495PII1_9FLAO|nr:AarF/UbiB family protein [Gillisia mitskevichiae]RKS50551.1 putative unusual protein kinase regulating ubiquinone biosynthesis (AarF/ABC1/UbiB family) [Gillisia mitskevichiae]
MSILPENLQRYQKFMIFMLKYWNSDLFAKTASTALNEDDPDENKSEVYDQTPEELVEDLKNMGPTYIKLGQLLSTRPDLLPDPYLQALASLQDDVPPIDYSVVQEIVEDEIGSRISKAFSSFDEEPLASASIGQVHKATLRSGKPVAVKIQRPGIRKQFLADLDTLKEMAEFAVKHTEVAKKYAFDNVLAELRHILLQELDYNREAQNLITLGTNLKEFRSLIVPQPILDYSSSKVLTMDFIQGKKITSISPMKKLENDLSPLVDELVEAYLKQIITDGFVHADPHPGNIHITNQNQIALIDLGMVAKFTTNIQEKLLQLLIALSQEDGEAAADVLLNMSELTDHADVKNFRRNVNQLIMDSQVTAAKEMETGRLLIQMNRIAANNGILISVEVNILGKIFLNMDQIIAVLDPDFDLKEAIRKHVHKMMRSKMYKELKPENLFSVALESKKLAEHLPERLNKISENLANNEFKIKVDAIDQQRFTDGFQKVANRITLGLIIAAMIVGAAMLMRVPSSFVIFGYPGLAIIFFMIAALGGIILSYVIIVKDEGFKLKK